MSRINQRLVAEDAIQLHAIVNPAQPPPDPGSMVIYTNTDRIACFSPENPVVRNLTLTTPPVDVNTNTYACTINDTHLHVHATPHAQVDVTLPSAPYTGKVITITDADAVARTHPIHVVGADGDSVHHDSLVVMRISGMALTFVYTGAHWLIH